MFFLLSQVRIEKVEEIMVVVEVPFITNVKDQETEQEEEYRLPVKFYSKDHKQFMNSPSINHNIFLSCNIIESEWASAASYRDPVTGTDYCIINPRTPGSLKVSTIELTLVAC